MLTACLAILPAVGVALATWAAVSILTVGLPMAFVGFGVRVGKLSSLDVPRRDQRGRPALVALSSSAVGLACLLLMAPNPRLIGVFVSGMTVLIVVSVVTVAWKVSAHVAVIANAACALGVFVDAALFAALVLAVPVAWARVRLRQHTLAQVAVGAAIGVVTAAGVASTVLAVTGGKP